MFVGGCGPGLCFGRMIVNARLRGVVIAIGCLKCSAYLLIYICLLSAEINKAK